MLISERNFCYSVIILVKLNEEHSTTAPRLRWLYNVCIHGDHGDCAILERFSFYDSDLNAYNIFFNLTWYERIEELHRVLAQEDSRCLFQQKRRLADLSGFHLLPCRILYQALQVCIAWFGAL